MRNIILVTLLFVYLNTLAQIESGVYVKLLPGNCQLCTVETYEIVSEIQENKFKVVIPESNNSYFKEKFIEFDKEQLYYSDSLYDAMNNSIHSAILICNNEKIAELKLDNINNVKSLKYLETFPCLKTQQEIVSLKLPISDNIRFDKNDDTFIFKDYSTKTIYYFNQEEKHKIAYSNINNDSIMKSHYLYPEYLVYHRGDSVMKHHNIVDNGNFGSFQLKNDTLNVLSTIQTYTQPRETFVIFRTLVIYKFYRGHLVDIIWFNEAKSKSEVISENGGFYINNNLVYVQVLVRKLTTKKHILKIYKIDAKNCNYMRNADFLPSNEMVDEFDPSFINYMSKSNDGLFSFSFYNIIFDANSSSTFEMPFDFKHNEFLPEIPRKTNYLKLDCYSNIEYFFGLYKANETVLLVTRNRDNSIVKNQLVTSQYDSNNVYSIEKDGIYVFNIRKQSISIIPY